MVTWLTVECCDSTPRRLSQWCTMRATLNKRAEHQTFNNFNRQLTSLTRLAFRPLTSLIALQKSGIVPWTSIKSEMLKLNWEGVAGNSVSISKTAAGYNEMIVRQ